MPKHLSAAFIGLAALATATAVAAQSASSSLGSAARGHRLLVQDCAVCHQVETTGDSPNPLAPRFRELHKRYPVEDLAEALAEGIMVGHPQMPQFRFAPDEVADVIHYLQSIQTDQRAAVSRAARSLARAAP